MNLWHLIAHIRDAVLWGLGLAARSLGLALLIVRVIGGAS